MTSPIKSVADTAYWVAYHRALETVRTDALFRDPFAARLAGERGRKMSENMPTSRAVAWTVALRTRIIDEYILAAIAGGVDTILNLGAGLDARPYRLALPAALHWIEADYPEIIDYKSAQLAGDEPRCRLELVKIDLADAGARQQLLARVNSQGVNILVLTEGVTPYLANSEVAALADDLRALEHVRFWILDYFSAEALEFRRRKAVTRAMENAPFKFAPGDWFAFFRQHGWQVKEIRYFAEESQKLGRALPFSRVLMFLFAVSQLFMPRGRAERMQKSAGYTILEPANADRK